MLQRLSLACVLGLASLLAGCSPTAEKIRPIRLHFTADPMSLDPGVGGEGSSQFVLENLFEGLTRLDKENKPELALAEKVDISPDYRHFRFTLKDTLWNNGMPLTAHDFEFAWKRIIAPESSSAFGYALYFIKNARAAREGKATLDEVGVRAVNDKTLEVELEFPCPYFLEMASNPLCAPICKEVVDKHPAWADAHLKHYVSNGPFDLREWRPGDRMIFEKNPNYWDSESIQTQRIEVQIISDGSTALALFEEGSLDWCGEPAGALPVSAIPQLAQEGRLLYHPYIGVYWLDVNTSHVPLNHKKVRQALAYAIDRNAITQHVLQAGERAATSILPSPINLGDEPHFPAGDFEKARQLFAEGLKELGIAKKDVPPITISLSGSDHNKTISEAIQQQWQTTLGIEVRLRAMDWTAFFDNLLKGDFDLGGSIWVTWYQDPIYNLEALKYTDNGINVSDWESPEYTRLLDLAKKEPNPNKRREFLTKAQAILLDELPIIPIYYTSMRYLANPQLRGYVLSPLGHVNFRWAYLQQEVGVPG